MITDERAKKLVDLVLDYCVELNKDDVLLLRAETAFEDFARLIGKKAEERGAKALYQFVDLKEEKAMTERSDDAELEKEAKRICALAKKATASIRLDSQEDPYYLQGVDPKKIAKYSEIVKKPLIDRIYGNGKEFKGVKRNVLAYPCEAQAREAGMTLEEYTDFVYNATLIDWNKMRESMKVIKELFDDAEDVHILVPGMTDLHLSLKGRGGAISDGKRNMPSGEVFYGVVEDSANGYISFPYPSLRNGNLVRGIKLWYKEGEVASFDVKENKEFFEAMLALEGVKRLGEFGIGCNYGIKNYMKNLLFDEKIGGTIHLALGESYFRDLEDGGGLNEAKIHWDLVCNLRKTDDNPGGSIYVNNKLVQENGIWVFK